MARIKGIDLPNEKRIEIALTYIYGIGRQLSRKILTNAKVNFDTKAKDITEDELIRIREEVNKHLVEGELRREVGVNIKRLMDLGCYRGLRHRKGLPVRGQSTKQNARTRKGKRKTVANKKK